MNKDKRLFDRLRATKGWRAVINVLRFVLAIDVLVVVLLIFANTISRYIFKSSFIWVEEILTICAMWMYFIGAVLGAEEESHIKGDLISTSIKNPKVKKWFIVAVSAVTFISCLFFVYWAVVYCKTQVLLKMTTQYLHLPKITSQFAVGFGMVGMAFYWLFHLLRNITRKPTDFIRNEPEGLEKEDGEV